MKKTAVRRVLSRSEPLLEVMLISANNFRWATEEEVTGPIHISCRPHIGGGMTTSAIAEEASKRWTVMSRVQSHNISPFLGSELHVAYVESQGSLSMQNSVASTAFGTDSYKRLGEVRVVCREV